LGVGPIQDRNKEKDNVAKEIKGNNWIRSIARLRTPGSWDIITSLQLVPNHPDSILWTLTADGKYSASSTYHAQFIGSHPRFVTHKIWNASAEPKCMLFAWLALHGKLLTSDMLDITGWPHDTASRYASLHRKPQYTYAKTAPLPPRFGNGSRLGTMLTSAPLPIA
jgi:hypothetical protein